ncbi:hypothetical protein [Endozoicomonas sp. 8E]|uniref:hypothetical protein n=1 Tax=Endozoicomonas sp. 8E TaxID=3035692 RepID=UPI00293950A4|nr:hypothetical protein [Endozoicomonas sp. 8E]WOG27052.1 hypothetical protein P6910_21255 [Endozoicomonas sp. 8E]
MLLSLSFVIQARPLTRLFIVEFEQDTGFPKQNFSVKPDRHTLPENMPNLAGTSGYAEPVPPPDNKRQKTDSYRLRTTFAESVLWQLLYTTQLLVGYELILMSKGTSPCSGSDSWIPVKAVVAVCWLIKSYWNPGSPLFNTIGQQETTFMLAQSDHPFAIITAMYGSGNNQQHQPPASSGQRAPETTIHHRGSFISPIYSDSNDSNRNPQQHSHTLDLNCFVNPCNGICRFRPAFVSRELAKSTLKTHSQQNQPFETLNYPPPIRLQYASGHPFQPQAHQPQTNGIDGNPINNCNNSPSMATWPAYTDHTRPLNDNAGTLRYTPVTNDDLVIVNGLLNLGAHSHPEAIGTSFRLNPLTPPVETSETQQTTGSPQLDQNPPHLSQTDTMRAINSRQVTCGATLVGDDGQERQCGKILKNSNALTDHRKRNHSGKKVCDVTLFPEGGQQQPCGIVFRNAQVLVDHKRRHHGGQKICDVIVFGRDGQQRPCGKVFKNGQTLYYHKRKDHSGEKRCDMTVVREDGQLQLCGTVCKNVLVLKNHKKRDHSRQEICQETVIGKGGQPQPCGIICNNAPSLSLHRRRHHTGQQTCDLIIVGEDGQPQRCGTVCKNAPSLSVHKSRYHTGPQACNLTVVGKNGQPRPCGKVCKNARALYDHKKTHRKREPVDEKQNNEIGP